MVSSLIMYLILIIFILVSVGFFTLLERSILGYIQIRKGPSKVGYMGLLQPFSDGAKLFLKNQFFPMNSNYFIFMFCPLMSLGQSLVVWVLFPFFYNVMEFNLGFLFFLCCSSFGIYGLMICGWSSNSIFSMLGCVRSISQAISYEVSLSLILLMFFFLVDGYSFVNFINIQYTFWFMFISFPIFFCWLSTIMAETNRTPFDFSEGESELVSGFNVEYGGGGFALLFISEYCSIIFMCLITCIIFLGSNMFNMLFYFKLVFLCFLFIWVRGTLPRYRYDKLMYLAWKCYLPISLNYMIFFILMKLMCFYHFFL